MKQFILSASVIFLFFTIAASGQTTDVERHQFDFWIGEWDVDVRAQQDDNSWKDKHTAVARIYPLLGGKAILELWSEKEGSVNGYSLRYYNPTSKKWDLWMNWPGKNRSGTSVLSGNFRHGRGEFFANQKIDARSNQITRFTFSDISRDSLRWDDAFSRDGGKTWLSHWIMEFSRRAASAPAIDEDKNLHTYNNGSTCDQTEFAILKEISAGQSNNERLRLYNVLDGCMLLGLLKTGDSEALFTLTFNTYANKYEMTFLDDADGTYLAVYYGDRTASGFELERSSKDGKEKTKALIEIDGKIKGLIIDYRGKEYSITP